MLFLNFSFPRDTQIISLARSLRPRDKRELETSHGKTNIRQLLYRFAKQSCQTAVLTADGETVAMGGVVPDKEVKQAACVWLLTGQQVEKYPKAFFKICRQCLEIFWRDFEVLYVFADERYTQAHRLIAHLGGKTDGSYRLCGGHKFLFFIFRRK